MAKSGGKLNTKIVKRVRVADIADELNLSSTTVSFVLNDRGDKGISEETTKLVLDTAAEMGYRPKAKTSMIGWAKAAFLTADIANFNFHTSFFAGVYSHLQRKSRDAKVELSLLEFKIDSKSAARFAGYQSAVDSGAEVFLSSSVEIVDFMREKGHQTILVQGGVVSHSICVYCDDYSAGSTAAEHAFEMGHREAGMVFPYGNCPRFNGFVDTFTKLGGVCPEKFFWIIPLDHNKLEKTISAKIAETDSIPSLFYCFADNVMFPAIRGFAAKGIRIPDDVSLIGTDNLYWGAYNNPAFTTVDLNEELFADKLIEAIGHASIGGDPYQLAVPVKLIPRETVRRL